MIIFIVFLIILLVFFGDYDGNTRLWAGAVGIQKYIRHTVPTLHELPA